MSGTKDSKNAPFNPFLFEEENFDYPSDRLTLRHLRLLWPTPEEIGEVIEQVRHLENVYAWGGALEVDEAAGRIPQPDPKAVAKLNEAWKDKRQFLKDFYIITGLASGEHAAELLIRGIEERARKQYPGMPR